VNANNQSRELAGTFTITLRPHKGVNLDTLETKLNALLEKLAKDGVDAAQLERVKSRYEASTVRRQETVGQRVSTLANYNTFTKNPGYFDEDMRRHMAVTTADVNRVLKQYVLGKPAVVLSIVPEGKKDLAAAKSAADATGTKTSTELAWKEPGPKADDGTRAKSAASDATALDRTKKPGPGPAITFRQPPVWHVKLDDGIPVAGTPYNILPITTLQLSVPAGRLHESMQNLGLASMTAELLQQGTRSLSATEFTEALDALGATLNASAGEEEITFTLTCLDKHLDKAIDLLGHVILEPRFSADDFKRIQKDRMVALETRSDQIRVIAGDVYRRLLWGDTVAGMPTSGTHDTVQKMKLEDVQAYWREHGSPAGARLTFVGQRDAGQVKTLFASLTGSWKSDGVAQKLATPVAKPLSGTKLYFVDKPGAPQSEVRIGHVSLASTDPDFYPLTVLNYPLGGLFSSRVNLNLREDKGYTYGARTALDGGYFPGAFTASAGVKTEVTKESVAEFMKELQKIKDGITEKELAFTKDSVAESTKRQYESVMALSGMLESISKYNWPDDYATQRLKELDRLTLDDMKRMASMHLHPDAMVVLVVGDKKKIAKGLAELGLGEPIELDIDGNPIEKKVGTN
jgi:zinc protease